MLMKRLFVFALPLLLTTAYGQIPSDVAHDFVAVGDRVVGMMPPVFVCGPTLLQAKWSPDGRYLMLLRSIQRIDAKDVQAALDSNGDTKFSPPEPVTDLAIWDRNNGTLRSALTFKQHEGWIRDFGWLSGADVATATVTGASPDGTPGPTQVLLIRPNGSASPIAGVSSDRSIEVLPAPSRALIGVVEQAGRVGAEAERQKIQILLHFFNADGREVGQVPFQGFYYGFKWSKDGKSVFAVHRVPSTKPGKKFEQDPVVIDPIQGSVYPTKDYPFDDGAPKPDDAPKALQVASLQPNVTIDQLTTKAPTVVLQGFGGGDGTNKRPEIAVVGTDAQDGLLNDSNDAVLYTSQGMVMVRPLVTVSAAKFDAMRIAAQRAVALSNAKQMGLALLMLSNDMDDDFPSNATGWQDKVEPYIKNSDILSSFIYTFRGGAANSISDPASTELGYVPGPGGRAVVYADGHARWLPDNP